MRAERPGVTRQEGSHTCCFQDERHICFLSLVHHLCPQHLNLTGKKVKVLVAQSCLTLCNLWTIACQTPLSVEFNRQEYWGGQSFPFSRRSSKPRSLTQVSCIAGGFFISLEGLLNDSTQGGPLRKKRLRLCSP